MVSGFQVSGRFVVLRRRKGRQRPDLHAHDPGSGNGDGYTNCLVPLD